MSQGKEAFRISGTWAAKVGYRGVKLDVQRASIIEEWGLKVYAMYVGDAVDQDIVPPLFVENSLLPTGRAARAHKIAAELLAEARIARSKAEHILADVDEPSSCEISAMLEKKGGRSSARSANISRSTWRSSCT